MGEKDMGKKKQKVLYDADGARRVMRKREQELNSIQFLYQRTQNLDLKK